MKKLVSVLLAAVCVLSMVACGGKAEEKKITSLDDLAGDGVKVGVQLGTTGDIFATDEYGEDAIERYNKGAEAVQALKQGKVQAVMIDEQPALEFVKANEGLKILETPFAEEEYAMAFKKGSELKDKVDAIIKELKEDGTFDAIVDFYINGKGERYQSPEGIEYTGKLVMATNAEFPPYEFHEDEEIKGLDVDFAKAIGDKLGMEIVIEDMAFDAIIPAVKAGKADFGLAGMTITEDRLKEVDFSVSYYTGVQVVIVKE